MADTVAPTKNYKGSLLSVSGSSIGSSGTPTVSDSITLGAVNQGELYVSYTKSASTGLNIIVEVSQDKSTWFQKSLLNIAGGSASGLNWTIPTYAAQYVIASSGALVIDLPISHAYLRLRIWASGTPDSGDIVTISVGGGAI